MLALFLVSALVSCGKNTDPSKLDKTLPLSSWRVGKAEFNNVNKTADFNGYNFHFKSNKDILVIKDDDTTKGAWTRGNYKDPLLFYMIFPQTATHFLKLDDDWIVTYLTKDEFRLQRNDTTEDEIIFRKKV